MSPSRCAIGARLAEFPTTAAAARASAANGIAVMMGAPNLLRGGSHSGNVAAAELAGIGCLDILSSDYAPASLLMGAVRLGQESGDMAAGLRRVTSAPAGGDRARRPWPHRARACAPTCCASRWSTGRR